MGVIGHSVDTNLQSGFALIGQTPGLKSNMGGREFGQRPASRESPAERLLAGRYLLEAIIGKGSMGTVFRARDLHTQAPCAVKMLTQMALREPDTLQRFANEAAVVARLLHPNIVELREFCRDENGWPFLVMELLQGTDLHSHLGVRRRLPLERVQSVVRQVASALHAVHSLGIIHRDIKPRNIFLAQTGGSKDGAAADVVKVVDFGLAKILGGKQHQTAAGDILGTIEYLAPEGTAGHSGLLDERTDQWALAVTAYRMLSGQLPFEDDDIFRLLRKIREESPPLISAIAPELPSYVQRALTIALSKNKKDRFPSVLDFMHAICGPAPAQLQLAPPLPPQNAQPARAAELPPAPQQGIDPLRQTQRIDPAILNQLIVQSQSGEPLAPGARPSGNAAAEPASLKPLGNKVLGAFPRSGLLLAGLALSLAGLVLYRSYHRVSGKLPSQAKHRPRGEVGRDAGGVQRMTVAPSSPPVMSSILGPTRQSAEGLMTDAAPPRETAAPVPYQAGPPGEPGTKVGKRPTATSLRRSSSAREYGAADELTAASSKNTAPLAAAAAAGSSPAAKEPATELQPARAPESSAGENAPPHGQSGSGASAQAGTKSVAVFEQARNLKPLFGPDPKIPGWLRNLRGREPLTGMYQVCITARGSVDRVNVLLSIPSADEEIISTLRTWQFPLLSSPLCIIKEFRFEPRD